MSGIAGFIDFKGDAKRYEDVYSSMLGKLQKRTGSAGSTGSTNGQYLSERACLLQTGPQPRRLHTNVITYDGVLYNKDELTKDLKARGHRLLDNSDTTILQHAYLQWGEQCLKRLNGVYAFALWDANKQKLFAARDRMGVKPLFYSYVKGCLIFASEIKALLCHPFIPAKVDAKGIAELFLIGPGRTPGFGVYKGIRELKPAHTLIFSKDGPQVKRYWKLKAHKHSYSFDETVETVRYLVQDAIKRQSKADYSLCVALSGGLDSSAICAISGINKSFSVDYEDNEKYFKSNSFQPGSDESYIKLMTTFLQTDHTSIVLTVDDLTEALFDAVEARDLPGMADVDSSLLMFARQIKKQSAIVMTGECADEIFGGYPWYRQENMRNRQNFPWQTSTNYRASFAKPGIMEEINFEDYVYQKYAETVADTELLPKDAKETEDDRRIRQMFRLNTDWFMQTLLERQERMGMANGLQARVPFCDHRLVEYLYDVPWEFKNYMGREKGLLRQALKGILPEDILWRKKSPYPKTAHPEYLKKVSSILQDIISSPTAPLLEIADKKALEKLLHSTDSDVPWYGQLMTLPQTIAYFIQINAWMEKYQIQILE